MRNKYATLWIWMCLCPLALDYKAPDGDSGHAAQILLVAPTLAAALALALIAPRFRHRSMLRAFVVARRCSVFTMLVFLGTVAVELLSVTRSLLVGTALLFAIAAWMSVPSLRHVLRATMRVAATGLAVAAMAGLAAWLFPSVTEHWAQRLFVAEATTTGKDPTTITRLAEMRDQYDQVTASTESLLLGHGHRHQYRYSPAYLPDLAGQTSKK